MLSVAAFTLQRQSQVVEKETLWLTKLTIFINWTFTKSFLILVVSSRADFWKETNDELDIDFLTCP